VVVTVLAVALHLSVTRVLYRPPSLESHVQVLPEMVLPFYSSSRQPLQPGPVVFAETDRVDANRIRYAAEVTLRLRVPLYVPASTNGNAAYRQLQESMQLARHRDIKFSLFKAEESPPHPDLPLLLQMSHRAGDSIVVRMPFEARRYGWKWRLLPAQIPLRQSVVHRRRHRILPGYAGSDLRCSGLDGRSPSADAPALKARGALLPPLHQVTVVLRKRAHTIPAATAALSDSAWPIRGIVIRRVSRAATPAERP
jgi:hypothetical protein